MSERKRSTKRLTRPTLALLTASLLLAGCASTHKLDKPLPLRDTGAVAAAADERIAVTIDTVIVRDGPGTWASKANWDEYLLRIGTSSSGTVEITGIAIIDSLGMGVAPRTGRTELIEASEEKAQHYQNAGIKVQAGVGASTLMGAGAIALGASAVGGISVLAAGTSVATTTATATAAAAGALIVAPALIVAGKFIAVEDHQVDREIRLRSTPLPLSLAAYQQGTRLDAFFPLAPAPDRMLVNYRDAGGQHTLTIDTKSALSGLHLPAQAPSLPAQAN